MDFLSQVSHGKIYLIFKAKRTSREQLVMYTKQLCLWNYPLLSITFCNIVKNLPAKLVNRNDVASTASHHELALTAIATNLQQDSKLQ